MDDMSNFMKNLRAADSLEEPYRTISFIQMYSNEMAKARIRSGIYAKKDPSWLPVVLNLGYMDEKGKEKAIDALHYVASQKIEQLKDPPGDMIVDVKDPSEIVEEITKSIINCDLIIEYSKAKGR